jgi:hypothetical protein
MMGVEMIKIDLTHPLNSKKSRSRNPLDNDRGFAVIESVVMIFIFLTLIAYTIGFWGVIHTATLQSIASRNYAMEIFRHRSNLWFFRGNTAGSLRYHNYGSRIHGTNNEISADGADKRQYATERRVAMFEDNESTGRTANEHLKAMENVQFGKRNTTISLDPVWIKVQYGMCLTAQCGD